MSVTILHGDCRAILPTLPDCSVQCCVTSPPYYNLRDYQVAGQIGLEDSPATYVAELVRVFREVKRVLRDDGTVWLNLGSSYASGGTSANQSRRPANAPAYGSDGTAPEDFRATGSACCGRCGGFLGGFLSHRARTTGTPPHADEGAPPRDAIVRDSGPPGCAEATLGASAPASRASNARASFRRDRAACVPADGASVSQPSRPTCAPASLASAHMSACTCGTGETFSPSAARRSGKGFSGAACDCGSCGICWAYLAIPSLRFKSKDLLDIPALVALALQADGWYLRSDIIWAKSNPMPESVRDRPTSAHEHVFLLSKRDRYFYDAGAIAETSDYPGDDRHNRGDTRKAVDAMCADGGSRARTGNPTGATRNARNVWTIATQPYSGAHFATMPPELAERCIKAGTSEKGACPHCGAPWGRVTERAPVEQTGVTPKQAQYRAQGLASSKSTIGRTKAWSADEGRVETLGWAPSCVCPSHQPVPCMVLDPFGGAGTTGLCADRLNRNAILIELNPEYRTLAAERITADAPLFGAVA